MESRVVRQTSENSELVDNQQLQEYVQQRLAGQIADVNGKVAAGPLTGSWTGRNKPHRSDRQWVQAWSPEQISKRLRIDWASNVTIAVDQTRSTLVASAPRSMNSSSAVFPVAASAPLISVALGRYRR
ncbi:hypothetical protein [Nocardia sp. NPDC049526]|uniref:hypothetical protein n=1 Tax=Nocardia sp. NPDC049526 TaxID=3364316 RepID=UPI00378C0347